MEIVILPTAGEVGRAGAAKIAKIVERKPAAVLGFATGSSPLAIYRELAQRRAAGLHLSNVHGFALDEYVGLPPSHPLSYASVIQSTVTEPLGLNPSFVHVPDGMADDIEAACARYDTAILQAGGVDIQILGIGSNGHIGFNEPTSSFGSRTRIKTLSSRTRADNARFFGSIDEVPTHCVTQGLGTISDARELLLIAHGQVKADAVAAAIEGPVSSVVPASVLQCHPKATVILDEEAASKLTLADYYRDTFARKPEWQHWSD